MLFILYNSSFIYYKIVLQLWTIVGLHGNALILAAGLYYVHKTCEAFAGSFFLIFPKTDVSNSTLILSISSAH